MKKLKNIIILLCVCLCSFFVACGNNGRNVNLPAIAMTTYFGYDVKSERTTDVVASLPSFVANTFDSTNTKSFYAHKSLIFYGDNAWMTGMFLECVYFYVVADVDLENVQFAFCMTGLDNSNPDYCVYDYSSQSYKVEQQSIGISTKANQGKLVRVDIMNKATTKGIVMKVNFVNPSSFKWTIYGFVAYGETRK